MSRWVQKGNYFMSGLFFLSIVVQFNDPDPIQWVLIYGCALITCLLFIQSKLHWGLPVVISSAALIWAGWLFPLVWEDLGTIIWGDVFGYVEMKTMTVEVTREILGLFIVAVWMAILSWAECKQR